MKREIYKTITAGLAGGVALNAALFVTFGLIGFGPDGEGILLSAANQSPKLIAVWTQIEPLPLVVSYPPPIIIGLVGFALAHAVIYRWLAPHWPVGIFARGWRLALLVFLLSFVFFEFFTPFNQYGEPLSLIAIELVFWAMVALVEAFVIAWVFER